MLKEKLRPSKELEDEIMEFIFSNRCTDHKAALKVWNNNPWIAVSQYEIAHYPENLGLSIAFPSEVVVPQWLVKKLHDEEMHAMAGNPIIIGYPRAGSNYYEVEGMSWEINKFGRVIPNEHQDDETGDY